VAIHGTHLNRVSDTVVFRASGAGIVTEDGSERGNLIERNFVIGTSGASGGGAMKAGRGGDGFWIRGPQNVVRQNVAATTTGHGFTLYFQHLTNMPGLGPVEDNEAYAVHSGLNLWVIPPGIIRDFRVWHHGYDGVVAYVMRDVVIDDLLVRGDTRRMDRASRVHTALPRGAGFTNSEESPGVILRRADIQGTKVGIDVPREIANADATFVVEDAVLKSYYGVTMRLYGERAARTATFTNASFAGLPASHGADGPQYFVQYVNNAVSGPPGTLLFRNYNRSGEDLQVFAAADLAPCQHTRPEIFGVVCPVR
jgi:hypothetical protein